MSKNKRSCKFCGEEGHNIRSCASLTEARKNIEAFKDGMPEKIQKLLEKDVPNSFLEGSLASCSFTPRKKEKSLQDFIPYYNRLRDACEKEISNILEKYGWDSNYRPDMSKLSNFFHESIVSVEGEQNQEISFFVSNVGFKPADNRRETEAASGALSRLDIKISDYIQEKIEEPGENKYKKIWNFITSSAKEFSDNYRGYEGKEGWIVASFITNCMVGFNDSKNQKTLRANRCFELILNYFCNKTQNFIQPSDCVRLEGEFFNVSSPSFELKLAFENLADLRGLNSTPEARKDIEEVISNAVRQSFFLDAKSLLDLHGRSRAKNETKSISLTKLNEFNLKNHFSEYSFWSERTALNGFFQEPGVPSDIADFYNKKFNFSQAAREEALKDFIKMAHTGGYYQSFSSGRMQKTRTPHLYVGTNSFLEEKIYSYGTTDKNQWVPTRCISFNNRYHPHVQGVSLADVVNGAIEALANSEYAVLEAR